NNKNKLNKNNYCTAGKLPEGRDTTARDTIQLGKPRLNQIDQPQGVEEPPPSLPRLQVKINGQQIWALLDTGASKSFIHPDLLQGHDVPNEYKIVCLACGQRVYARGPIEQRIYINGQRTNIQGYVMEEMAEHLILGQEWMLPEQATLDFQYNCVYFGTTYRRRHQFPNYSSRHPSGPPLESGNIAEERLVPPDTVVASNSGRRDQPLDYQQQRRVPLAFIQPHNHAHSRTNRRHRRQRTTTIIRPNKTSPGKQCRIPSHQSKMAPTTQRTRRSDRTLATNTQKRLHRTR
ncbi:hypothetical protein NQ314_018259, partial [Rhamnusium bicolor]